MSTQVNRPWPTWLMNARMLACAMLVLSLVSVHLGTTAPSRAADLFRASNYRGDTALNEMAVARSRAMNVNMTMLERAANGVIDELPLNLFNDARFTARIEHVARRGEDAYSLFGTLVEDEQARFLVVYEQGAILMNLFSKFGDYQVRAISGSLVAVQQLDSSQYPECGCGPEHEIGAAGGNAQDQRGGLGLNQQQIGMLAAGNGDDGSIIDVIIFWTPEARQAAGGLANMQALVQGSIDISNIAYVNSDIDPRLRLVHSQEINYTETNMSTDLGRLRATNDGHMDQVHALRDQYGADMVALIVEDGSACGIAYLMTNLDNGFASSAFSVSNYSCAVGNLTFPHELGHNMGSAHDRNNAGNALFSYSYGWRWFGQSGNQFRSVMAYAPGSRVPHFSNPDVTYDGTPTGVNNSENNALSINQAAFTVANWRPTAAPLRFEYPDGQPTVIDPVGQTVLIVEIIEQLDQTLDPSTAQLVVDAGSGFSPIPLNPMGNGRYQANFPPAECGTYIDYYVSAETTGDVVVTDPRDAPAASFQAYVAADVLTSFEDNFETDQGWSVVNSPSLTDGAWNRGVPVGGGDRGDPPTDFDGSGQCYLTDNAPGNSDVDGGSTTLISPVFDASGGGDVYISYARWFSNDFGAAPGQDVFRVDISNNGGQTWTSLEVVGPTGPGTTGGWFHVQHRIADFLTPTDQMRVRFIAADDEPGSVVEAAVDAIEVVRFSCGSTELTEFSMVFGTLLAGGLDELRESDEATVRFRSRFGFTALEPNFAEMQVAAETNIGTPATLDIAVESRINHPVGQATLRVRNWASGQFQVADSWSVGTTESRHDTLGLSAADRVRESDGRIEIRVRYVVAAVFTALGFDSFVDQVEISAN